MAQLVHEPGGELGVLAHVADHVAHGGDEVACAGSEVSGVFGLPSRRHAIAEATSCALPSGQRA